MATTGVSERDVSRSGEGARLSPDDLFHSLQNERRRRVLRTLIDASEEPLAMGDVAEAVAAAENECEARLVSSDQRKRVYVALYQNHLPQLDDVGLIEYDQNRGRVAAGPALEQAATYLEMTAPEDAPDGADADSDAESASESGSTPPGADASSGASTNEADAVDDEGGRFVGVRELTDLGGVVAACASGSVAAVGVVALAAVWSGVLAASTVLAAVVAVSLVAFVLTVALAGA